MPHGNPWGSFIHVLGSFDGIGNNVPGPFYYDYSSRSVLLFRWLEELVPDQQCYRLVHDIGSVAEFLILGTSRDVVVRILHPNFDEHHFWIAVEETPGLPAIALDALREHYSLQQGSELIQEVDLLRTGRA